MSEAVDIDPIISKLLEGGFLIHLRCCYFKKKKFFYCFIFLIIFDKV